MNQPLTLPVTMHRSRNLDTPPEPLPPRLRQKMRFSRPEAPSIDECPLGRPLSRVAEPRARHRPRAWPPEPGFRCSFVLRYEEEGLDSAASASSSLAGARCHAPLVDFCNRNDPQARPSDRRNPSWRSHSELSPDARSTGSVRRLLTEERSRVVTGQGLMSDFGFWLPSSAPLDPLARIESFAPTRFGSDTSCR